MKQYSYNNFNGTHQPPRRCGHMRRPLDPARLQAENGANLMADDEADPGPSAYVDLLAWLVCILLGHIRGPEATGERREWDGFYPHSPRPTFTCVRCGRTLEAGRAKR